MLRIQNLEKDEETLRAEVLENERKVGEKVNALIESQPISSSEKDKEDSEKAAKVKKAEINIEDISDKVNEFREIVSEVGKVKDLKDEEIREKVLDTKRN